MNTSLRFCFLLPFMVAATACEGSTTPEPARDTSATAPTAQPGDLAGTWRFDLEASDVRGPIREQCARSSAGDPAKATACWDEIAAEARREKVRFSAPGVDGRAVWTSFAAEGAREIVFLEVPVDLVTESAGHFLAKVAGPATGAHKAQFEGGPAGGVHAPLRVELVDAQTLVMADSKKGRLVYTKE